MRNRCHWFQVQRDIMEWSANKHYHPWMLNMTTCTDRQTINFSFFVRNYGSFWVCWKLDICRCSLPSRSNLDWVGERGDLQGLHFTTTVSGIPVAHHVRTMMAFDTFAGYPRCADVPDSSLFLTIYNDSYSFIMYHIRIQIHQHLSKDTLLDAVHGVLSFWSSWRHTLWQINDLGALEMSLLTLQARVQSLVTAHHHHKATRKDSPILAEPQQSINNVKAWAVLQTKASFADDFRARPIVNEEEGFVAEKPMCFCTAAVSLDVKPRPLWNNDETYWLSVWEPYF